MTVYAMPRFQLRTLCTLGKHSTKWAMSQPLWLFNAPRWEGMGRLGILGRNQELRPIHLILSECVHYCYELWLNIVIEPLKALLDLPRTASTANHGIVSPGCFGLCRNHLLLSTCWVLWWSDLGGNLWIIDLCPQKGFVPLKVWKVCSSLYSALTSVPHFTYIWVVSATQWIKPSWKTWFKSRNLDSYKTGKILGTLAGIEMLFVLIDLKIIAI